MLFCFPLILIGCTESPGQILGGRLSKKKVLRLDPYTDIFEFENRIIKNMNWMEEKLTKGKQVMEITKGMANKLPI